MSACDRPTPMDPGVLFEVAPDIVLTFDYETPEARITAHRFTEGGAFRVTVETRDGEFRNCVSDAAFNRLLVNFELLKIQRRLEKTELEQLKKDRSFHRLRIVSQPPMEAWDEILTPLKSGQLMLESQGFSYELSLSTYAVNQLTKSCGSGRARSNPEP